MEPKKRAYLELHIAVFLFGFTAILGALIDLSAMLLVWWRMGITCLSFFFLFNVFRTLKNLERTVLFKLMGIGLLVALHWLCFFGAIKLANASITLVCMATTSLFTAILEPLIFRERIRWYEMALGLAIIPGMALVVNATGWSMLAGIIVGILSALLASSFAILNKTLVVKMNALTMTFVELGSGWLFLSLLLPFFFSGSLASFFPSWTDLFYLLVLALACTTLAYVLALRSLRHITAFASNLTINLEPVYGIALAWLILGENKVLSLNFYLGCAVIIATVFAYPVLRKRLG